MEAHSEATSWQTVIQVVGAVLGTIFLGFMTAYSRWKTEHSRAGEDVVQKSVGAAFVDRGVAKDLARVADNTDKIVDMVARREERWREEQLLKKLEERLSKPHDEDH